MRNLDKITKIYLIYRNEEIFSTKYIHYLSIILGHEQFENLSK